MPLTESDTCMRLITPALEQAGWNVQTQIRRQVAVGNRFATTKSVPA